MWIKNVNGANRLSEFGIFRRDPNDFLPRLVTMEKAWLYHYDRIQSNNQRSDGIAAHPD